MVLEQGMTLKDQTHSRLQLKLVGDHDLIAAAAISFLVGFDLHLDELGVVALSAQ